MTAAYRVDGEVVSAERFYALACDPTRPVVVEACAGAGKTWMLVSRVLRALLQGARPQDILAITFTRKAAGEMRARLQEWLLEFALCPPAQRVQALRQRGLNEAQAQEAEPLLAALHERLLDAGRMVEVRTFHSWFGQLLRHAPMDVLEPLGLHPDMNQVEDPTELMNECWRPFLHVVHADASLKADFTSLVQDRSRHAVRQWLEASLHKRIEFALADEAGVLEASVPAAGAIWPDRALELGWDAVMAASPLQALWREAAESLAAAKGVKNQDAAQGLVQALALSGQPAYLQARKALLTEKGEPRKLLDEPVVRQATTAVLELAEAEVQQRAHGMHVRMVRLSRAWHQVYARHKRARGLVDMPDLERCALHLLRDAALSGWVQEQLDARVRHLLIDEFQDTSPLQWQTLQAWLSAYAGAGGGAGAPSVFIVGDPKQSIYRFRGAEPKVFSAAQDFVRQSFGGQLLSCDHTRRNAPEVIAAVNATFEQVRGFLAYDAFRPHTTASDLTGAVHAHATHPKAARGPAVSAALTWRESLTEARESPTEKRRMQEARQVARHVAARIADGLAPSQVQVLARKRETLRLVGQALHELHVPHVAPEATRLMDTPEAADLLALMDALVSPRHALSLAQALRSPVFQCTDEDLIALAQAAGRGGDWVAALVSQPWAADSRLARAGRLLSRWRHAAEGLPPHDLLARIVAEGEVRERYAAAVPQEGRGIALEHLDAVLALALDLDGGRYATPYNFVRAVRRRVVDAPALAREEAVQLLTIHGAKGLEADLVCVVDADPEPPPPESSLLLVDWPTEAAHPRQVAFVASRPAEPALSRWLARRRGPGPDPGRVQCLVRGDDAGAALAGVQCHPAPPASATSGLAPGARAAGPDTAARVGGSRLACP